MHPPISLLQLLVPDDPLTHASRVESIPTRADAAMHKKELSLNASQAPSTRQTNETSVPYGVEGRL